LHSGLALTRAAVSGRPEGKGKCDVIHRFIRAGQLYDGVSDTPRPDCAVVIEDGRIAAVTGWADRPSYAALVEADIVAPGFVDLQINGGGGVLFNDAPTPETLAVMARAARAGGAAWILPTFITHQGAAYETAIAAVAASNDPSVLGLHLEGPFLSPAKPGIHPADAIRTPTEADIATLCAADKPLLVTLAPEIVDVAQIARLAAAGVAVFAGHSDAGSGTLRAAEASGLRGATHLFNAMRQMTARDPGVVGAVLASDTLFAGIIADGLHVDPVSLTAAYRALGADRLFLVSDAMPTLGSDIAAFDLLGTPVTRSDGRLTGPDGTLAGADLTMAQAVARMDAMTGCGLGAAIRMAAATPARALGIDDIGRVAPGMRAGLTLMSEDLGITGVMVDGLLC
jgi:N-acetylglucosamine-6-phosphate deacetylase